MTQPESAVRHKSGYCCSAHRGAAKHKRDIAARRRRLAARAIDESADGALGDCGCGQWNCPVVFEFGWPGEAEEAAEFIANMQSADTIWAILNEEDDQC